MKRNNQLWIAKHKLDKGVPILTNLPLRVHFFTILMPLKDGLNDHPNKSDS